LLSRVLGASPVERGRITLGSETLLDTAAAVQVPLEYRCLGYVPQGYAIFPHLNVRENVAFSRRSRNAQERQEQLRRVEMLLSELGLTAHADRRVQSLSGGEKQRVALARALAHQPRALLLDEPLAALDVHTRHEVRLFLGDYLKRLGLPTLLVTHDPEDARLLAHKILVLEGGKVSQQGSWQDLVSRPATRFIEQFVAGAPSVNGGASLALA
jgi:molybdate transport system ATP-binding protein